MKRINTIKGNKGITLIALVVTIVVLLILAAVSIGMLTGENGIISQSKEAKDDTEIADEKEKIEISSVSAAGKDTWGNITKDNLKEELDKNIGEGKYTLEGEGPFTVTYIESNRSYIVNTDGNIASLEKDIYDEDVSEEDIAPTEIFEYEIISDAETGATSLDLLPTKEARILWIKPQYCNNINNGYTTEEGKHYEDTNYEIVLEDGTKISDTLVIPYQVEINGEMYKITEANITAAGSDNGTLGKFCMPNVKTIIFPNTIEKISGAKNYNAPINDTISKIVLSKNLKVIENNTFYGCKNLISIEIPNNMTSIGAGAFSDCENLESIVIPNGVTIIESNIFSRCLNLKSIEIPSSVTSIEYDAFWACSSLTTVNYTGTMEQWKQINIGFSNTYLTNAKIICTDGIINE